MDEILRVEVGRLIHIILWCRALAIVVLAPENGWLDEALKCSAPDLDSVFSSSSSQPSAMDAKSLSEQEKDIRDLLRRAERTPVKTSALVSTHPSTLSRRHSRTQRWLLAYSLHSGEIPSNVSLISHILPMRPSKSLLPQTSSYLSKISPSWRTMR